MTRNLLNDSHVHICARVAVLLVERYKYLDQKLHRCSHFRDGEVIANRSLAPTRVVYFFYRKKAENMME